MNHTSGQFSLKLSSTAMAISTSSDKTKEASLEFNILKLWHNRLRHASDVVNKRISYISDVFNASSIKSYTACHLSKQ